MFVYSSIIIIIIAFLDIVYIYVDINDCEDDPEICGMNANCINTIGSYMCSCSSGYTGDETMCTGECKCCCFS